MIQACNPPDIFWPLGAVLRAGATGCRFVFDQHDLCPELYDSRFPDGLRLRAPRTAAALERAHYRTADHVIVDQRLVRAGRDRHAAASRPPTSPSSAPGPTPMRLHRRDPIPSCASAGAATSSRTSASWARRTASTTSLRAAHDIVHVMRPRRRRASPSWAAATATTSWSPCATSSASRDYVEFTGRVPDDVVVDVLSTADIGLSPDPKNPLNDVSTMNKTLEYMAFGLPVVAFDLKETRVSAGHAAVYRAERRRRRYARGDRRAARRRAARRRWMGSLGRRGSSSELGVAAPARRLRRGLRPAARAGHRASAADAAARHVTPATPPASVPEA